jgi:hypothetical protein
VEHQRLEAHLREVAQLVLEVRPRRLRPLAQRVRLVREDYMVFELVAGRGDLVQVRLVSIV